MTPLRFITLQFHLVTVGLFILVLSACYSKQIIITNTAFIEIPVSCFFPLMIIVLCSLGNLARYHDIMYLVQLFSTLLLFKFTLLHLAGLS